LSEHAAPGTTALMDIASPELAIRARRALFNRAIAAGDLNAIGPILARDCVMLTGTDSAVIAGRLAQVKVWRREFASATRDIYVRKPCTFDISAVAPIALEHGIWTAEAPTGERVTGGTYSAKWRAIRGEWLIEAELFITLG
jgi:ketosteroid isomerase-like protein